MDYIILFQYKSLLCINFFNFPHAFIGLLISERLSFINVFVLLSVLSPIELDLDHRLLLVYLNTIDISNKQINSSIKTCFIIYLTQYKRLWWFAFGWICKNVCVLATKHNAFERVILIKLNLLNCSVWAKNSVTCLGELF